VGHEPVFAAGLFLAACSDQRMLFIRHEYQGMSAAPLPPVQTVAPQANTPSPSPQRNSQRDGDAKFDAHLHDAQRQQTSSSDDSSSDASDNSGGPGSQAAANTPVSVATSAGTLAPSNAAQADAAQGDSDTSDTSSVTSLASSMLNLIDQATGESGSESGSTGAAAKSTAGKATAQTSGNNQTTQATPIAPLLPTPPAPQAVAAKANASSNAKTDNSTVQANASAANSATSPTALQNATAALTGTSANDSDDDTDDSGATSVSSVDSAAAQGGGDGAQTLAATAMMSSHILSAAAAVAPSFGGSTQNAPDFASIRGALDATAVATQPAVTNSTGHALSNNSPVGSSGFAKELGQQVTWLSGQEVKQAQIRLNPENLGPLDVKVSVEHGRVDVAFMTQHPETAAAVQQGLDHLNQMLGGQGLSLGHATVGQHAQQQQYDGSQQQASSQTSGDADDANDESAAQVVQRVAVGLVDAFA
jgi:flagellar hook-length control protein FliK